MYFAVYTVLHVSLGNYIKDGTECLDVCFGLEENKYAHFNGKMFADWGEINMYISMGKCLQYREQDGRIHCDQNVSSAVHKPLGSGAHSFQCIPRTLSSRVKLPEREAYLLLPEATMRGAFTSALLVDLHDVCLGTHFSSERMLHMWTITVRVQLKENLRS
jgi:hypothetical protein